MMLIHIVSNESARNLFTIGRQSEYYLNLKKEYIH